MQEDLICWKCGAPLADLPQPLSRRAECPACRAELHVCRMCRHYDTAKAKHCRELAADEVKEKTRANFCDWFQATTPTLAAAPGKPNRAELDALFGGSPAQAPDAARQALDDLFGKKTD